MSAFDLLTAEDKAVINRYITSYGGYDAMELPSHCAVEDLLSYWDGAKTGFLSALLGNKLLLEKKINIQTPDSILWNNMEKAIYPYNNGFTGIEFIENFHKWCHPLPYETYEWATDLVSIGTLTKNIYEGDSFEIKVPNRVHPLQVNKGCKVAKILGKIAEAFNIEGYEEFRLKHSMALNQKRFEGTLCLSIHPLDYMTMSDNDCDWDSCMSWQKPGEYREGTVEMMNSPYILVGYLKAEKDMKLFCGDDSPTWGNKRWRELFVVSPDVITGIRGYPYCDSTLEKEVFKWITELAEKNCPWCHYEGPIEYDTDEKFDFLGQSLRLNYNFEIMYNDFGNRHTAYLSPKVLEKRNTYDQYNMNLSGATLCLCCGETWEDSSTWDSQSLICPTCAGEIKCDNCGEFHDINEMTQLVGEEWICPDCVDVYVRECNYCNDLNYKKRMRCVNILHDGSVDTTESFHLCNDCITKHREAMNEYYGTLEDVEINFLWSRRQGMVIDYKNLTLNGFRAFGYYTSTVEEARKMIYG